MRIKYYIQKLLGMVLDTPAIPEGKTVGFSLVRSEKSYSDIGEKAKVYPPFFLREVKVGNFSYVAKNCNINRCEIGKFCSIGPNFCCGLGIHPTEGVSTSPMFYSTAGQNGTTLCKENLITESEKTHIGNDVFIGANVTVLDGVTIGDGAVIGAGAVVTKDIPPYAIAAGVPATVKKYRFDEATIAKLMKKQWWNGDEKEIEQVRDCFFDMNKFLQKEF